MRNYIKLLIFLKMFFENIRATMWIIAILIVFIFPFATLEDLLFNDFNRAIISAIIWLLVITWLEFKRR
jgi:hypothetical protein